MWFSYFYDNGLSAFFSKASFNICANNVITAMWQLSFKYLNLTALECER
jgi:hypothetical protein